MRRPIDAGNDIISDPHTSSIFKEIYLVGTHINRNP